MKGRTFYALAGDWLGWLCLVLALGCIGRTWQLARRPQRPPAKSKNKKRERP